MNMDDGIVGRVASAGAIFTARHLFLKPNHTPQINGVTGPVRG
jgi:hypothetical protein